MAITPSVTIITVTYNSSRVLRTMLESVPKGVSVVVVDNASQDNSVVIAEQFGATVLRNNENIGFARGCNMGAAVVGDCEFLFFLNPDTELFENTVDELIQAVNRYPSVAAFNPRILTPAGEAIDFRSDSKIVPYPNFMPSSHPDSDCEIVTLRGAAIFVSRKNFDKVGGYDENLFFGWDDDDISFRFQLKCGPLMSIHAAKIVHLKDESSPSNYSNTMLKLHHQKRGEIYIKQKYGVPVSVIREFCWVILKLSNGKILFSKRHRIKYFSRFSALWSVIKEGALINSKIRGSEKWKPTVNNQKKLHVSFAIDTMDGGGAELSVLTIMESLLVKNYRIDLVMLDFKGPRLSSIPKGINLIVLDRNFEQKKNLEQCSIPLNKIRSINRPKGLKNLAIGVFNYIRSLKFERSGFLIPRLRHFFWTSSMAEYLNSERPDLVVAHLLHSGPVCILGRRIASLHVPILWSIRNNPMFIEVSKKNKKYFSQLIGESDRIHTVSNGIAESIIENQFSLNLSKSGGG